MKHEFLVHVRISEMNVTPGKCVPFLLYQQLLKKSIPPRQLNGSIYVYSIK